MLLSKLHPLFAVAIGFCLALPSREAPARRQSGVHAVVDARSGMLFGGTANGRWIDAEHLAPRINGNERYHLYGFSRSLGESMGSKPGPLVPNCGSPEIDLKLAKSNALVGIAGNWNALPRIPRQESITQAVYHQAVRDFLRQRGVRTPQFSITQIVRCDLDGNDQDEVLICVDQVTPSQEQSCLLLLRKIVRGRVRTISIATARPYHLPSTTRLVALLDVNGDGRMEIITETHIPDGVSQEIWQVDGIEPRVVLNWGCGV